MLLANHTVQVTIEANTNPTMTAWTTTSAVKNMDQGDRSRGRWLLVIAGNVAGSAVDCAWAKAERRNNSTSPQATLGVTLHLLAPRLPLRLGMPIGLRLGGRPT